MPDGFIVTECGLCQPVLVRFQLYPLKPCECVLQSTSMESVQSPPLRVAKLARLVEKREGMGANPVQDIKMTTEKHPDVMLYYSYSKEHGEKIHLRIVTFETPNFSHGLGLEYTFIGPERKANAEKFAVLVQEYVDLLKNPTLA